MMSHQEAAELLAVFALDALEGDEHELIEAHLAECPRCRAELDAHREVAAALGNSVEPLPEGLWSSIAGALPPHRDQEPPPMPTLVRDQTAPDAPARSDAAAPAAPFATPGPARRRASRGRLFSVASLAVAAAAVAAVLGVNLVDANNQVAQLQGAIGETAHTAVVAALETQGHKVVNLKSTSGKQLAEFVVLPSGQGYLVSSTPPGALVEGDLPTVGRGKWADDLHRGSRKIPPLGDVHAGRFAGGVAAGDHCRARRRLHTSQSGHVGFRDGLIPSPPRWGTRH